MTGRGVVPYIVKWSDELDPPALVVAGRSGIRYADETLHDRDQQGVLWARWVYRPGAGHPDFGVDHPMRQRRAMRKLLCMVCGDPADQTEEGTLWLLRDHRDDWPDWPNGMANAYPPVCLPCARLSTKMCPALRKGYVAIRAHSEISGVFGMCYRNTHTPGHPEIVGPASIAYDDPRIHWTRATKLIRTFHAVTMI